MGGIAGAIDVVSWFLLPGATLVAWVVRLVGSLRRRDASYGLMPILGATVLALVLLVVSFVLPDQSSTFGGRLGAGDVVAVNALATLVLVLAVGLVEVPLWGVRSALDSVRRRRPAPLAPARRPSPRPARAAAAAVTPSAGSSAAGITPAVLSTGPAPAAIRPDEAA